MYTRRKIKTLPIKYVKYDEFGNPLYIGLFNTRKKFK